jgi:hypothetical protein
MNITKAQTLTTMLILLCQDGQAQGFINLDFERATIVQNPSSPGAPYAVYARNAIPGWIPTSILGADDIIYNTSALGATTVSIFDIKGPAPIIEGEYSIQLFGGQGVPTGASISQTSLVPVDAESILFKAKYSGLPGGTLLVSLGGQNVSFSAISPGPNYTLYGGDVSAFAGQVQQLMFTAPPGVNNYWELDDIQFSNIAVPEPRVFVLFASYALLLGWRVLRRRR